MCLEIEQIAALASGEGEPASTEHVASCAACAEAVREQREMASLAARWIPPPMPAKRRAELAAEVLARSDAPAATRSSRGWIALGCGAAAAAAIAMIALGQPGSTAPAAAPAPVAVETPVVAAPAPVVVAPAPVVVAPAPRAADIAAHGAQFTRARIASRDTVQLRDGELVVETRDREPAVVVAHGAEVSIDHARVAVVVRGGVVVSLHVFAGSAEMSDGGVHRVIEAGEVWTRPVVASAPPLPKQAPETPSPSAIDSLVAFREGWQSLQAGDNTAAIAAFDRATDPVVAEDASFWAAVAEQRAGHVDDAAHRLHAFLDAFPASPRADAARTRLATLDAPP